MTEPANPMELAQRLAKGAALPRRFYTTAEAATEGDETIVKLDGRTARTPGRTPFAFRDREIAEAIAAEWSAQGEFIDPTTMPLTRIANSALDGVAKRMTETAADIAAYACNDLMCYRAPDPEALAARQSERWDPLLLWAREAIGVKLIVGEGIVPVRQPPETTERVRAALTGFDPLRLAALHVATTLTGSAILALAVARGRISAEEAWATANVDEDWQTAQWGEDHEAAVRRARRWRDMAAAAFILTRPG